MKLRHSSTPAAGEPRGAHRAEMVQDQQTLPWRLHAYLQLGEDVQEPRLSAARQTQLREQRWQLFQSMNDAERAALYGYAVQISDRVLARARQCASAEGRAIR